MGRYGNSHIIPRQQLSLLIFLISQTVLICCKDKVHDKPVTVSGRITDQDGNPVIGAGLLLLGYDKKSPLSGTETFHQRVETDSEGKYVLSYIPPKSTDQISVNVFSTDRISITSDKIEGDYIPYVFWGGSYRLAHELFIPKKDWENDVVHFRFTPFAS